MSAIAIETKRCSRCSTVKPRSEFGVNRAKRDKLAIYCLACMRQLTKLNYQRTRRTRLAWALTRKYGITQDDYDSLLQEQGGVCAICKQPETARSRSGGEKLLAVDHDHESGNIRGLLCYRCNIALGYMREDPSLLTAAAIYLKGVE